MSEVSVNDNVNNEVIEDSAQVETKKKFKPDIKNCLILLFDYIFIILAYVVSLMSICPLDGRYVNGLYITMILIATPFFAMTVIIFFFIFKLYVNSLMDISVVEVRRLIIINFISIFVYVGVMTVLKIDFPYVFYLVGGLLQFIFTAGIRFVYKLLFVKAND